MNEVELIAALKQRLPQCLLVDQVRLGARLARALSDRRQGRHPALPLDRWLRDAETSIRTRQARGALAHQVSLPTELPITVKADEIVEALRQHPVIVVAGETGSGKTTQLPKLCLRAGLGQRARIGCTQPRRVAALSIARRLADELRVEFGREVGAKIRFSDRTQAETSVKVMTDGILLAEIHSDPLLAEYDAIIVDEAHERSINIDFLLGYLKHLLAKRDDLKLIITSATIDTERFSQAFDRAPVIEVSGRLYPVEVRHQPVDEQAEEEGELTYVDAAVQACLSLFEESGSGDLLVFMPSERDIRETCEALETRCGDTVEPVPLFGRLTAAEQQRVFAPGNRRRVVVATNIAETSLTVPRIRYVVDTGLARISRYHAGTRTRRLPVEPISQSSARQRQGRCGRLSAGVCVRLYAETDFLARRPHTEPEIQRCNLADVILRLKALGVGEIETFPFLDPPPASAIRGAYELLQEIGALGSERELTSLGAELSRLPVDPAVGRMILEARAENALREVLVIAAGLSIQDPRERPMDKRDAADAAQRRFQHPGSDFLTLLNIWNVYHDTWDSLRTQSQLRKFCKSHFLSFVRMREWRDIHAQLADTLEDLEGFRFNEAPASEAAIHRSILTGLWGHVAQQVEGNHYVLSGNRQAMIFPGSSLFQREAPRPRKGGPPPTEPPRKPRGPKTTWIVAGEIVETTRLFARTVAPIDPAWILELAPHLLRLVHLNPRWDPRQERVIVTERHTLKGLVIREQEVSYVKVDPGQATQLFVRAALIDGGLTKTRPFQEHNRKLCEKIELWQTRMRERVVPDITEALFQFYVGRLDGIGSARDLDHWVRTQPARDCLCASEADLLGEHAKDFDSTFFPDHIEVAGESVAVSYAYAPGEDRDGVTLRLAAPLAEHVPAETWNWLVPTLREERVLRLLQSLPKALRRPLMPLPITAARVAKSLPAGARDYLAAVSEFLRTHFQVEVPVSTLAAIELPPYLQPRFELAGRDQQVVATGRDLVALQKQIVQHATAREVEAWQATVQRWERYGLTEWSLGELPRRVEVTGVTGLPLFAYPGLQVEHGALNLRLFRQEEESVAANREGIPFLAERVLSRELAWLRADLKSLNVLKTLYVTLGPGEELTDTAWENLRRYWFGFELPPVLDSATFGGYVETVRGRIPGSIVRLVDWLKPVLECRQRLLLMGKLPPAITAELASLVPPRFLVSIPYERLQHLPRYLQALQVRAERARLSPAKDAEKASRVQPYVQMLQSWRSQPQADRAARELWVKFSWLLEEFKVSCFAQELGTAEPVSAKRLDALAAEIRSQTSSPRK